MHPQKSFFFILVLLVIQFTTNGQTIRYIQPLQSESELETINRNEQTPLLIYNGAVFSIASDCVGEWSEAHRSKEHYNRDHSKEKNKKSRHSGSDEDKGVRHNGQESGGRNSGGDTDQRNSGSDQSTRNSGGDLSSRNGGNGMTRLRCSIDGQGRLILFISGYHHLDKVEVYDEGKFIKASKYTITKM